MSTMARVALATYSKAPALAPDDQLLVPALANLGIAAGPAIWNDPGVDWAGFDAVIVRSCWDYHRHIGDFRVWVDHLDAIGVRVWNPPATLRWNADKRYLQDLLRRGVSTIPTAWIARGSAAVIGRDVVIRSLARADAPRPRGGVAGRWRGRG